MVELLLKNEQEIIDILTQMSQYRACTMQTYTSLQTKPMLARLKTHIHQMRSMLSDDLGNAYQEAGAMVMLLIEKEQRSLDMTKFAAFLMDKHQKYGASPIIESGTLGILFRINSKIARFENMRQRQSIPNGPSPDEEDTLLDILGYCVLGYRFEGEWTSDRFEE
jgi:DNA relaxase NicK